MWDRPRRSPAVSSTRSASSRQAHPMPSPLRPFVLAVIVSCAAALAGSGCDNTITSSEALPPLEMVSLDSNAGSWRMRSEEHTSELQSPCNLVCRLLLEKKKTCRANTVVKEFHAAQSMDLI